jgi:hypothetical protein
MAWLHFAANTCSNATRHFVMAITAASERVEPVWPHQRWVSALACREKIMSKTNDPGIEDRTLADSELDAVSGGWTLNGIPGAQPPPPQPPRPTGYLKWGDIELKRPV